MITISNSIFDAKGSDRKASVYGITVSGNEDVTIENCKFQNTGYSAILNNGEGKLNVVECEFDCNNMYNPVEGSQSVANGDVTIENCEFVGAPGNNFINFYKVAEGSDHKVVGCKFNPTVDNNTIRFSNRNNAAAKFVVKDCEYDYQAGEPTDYTGFILCQDYTNKNGVKQDFTKYAVVLDNVKCNGVKVADGVAAEGSVYYVYEDGVGIITGQNDPVVSYK